MIRDGNQFIVRVTLFYTPVIGYLKYDFIKPGILDYQISKDGLGIIIAKSVQKLWQLILESDISLFLQLAVYRWLAGVFFVSNEYSQISIVCESTIFWMIPLI